MGGGRRMQQPVAEQRVQRSLWVEVAWGAEKRALCLKRCSEGELTKMEAQLCIVFSGVQREGKVNGE